MFEHLSTSDGDRPGAPASRVVSGPGTQAVLEGLLAAVPSAVGLAALTAMDLQALDGHDRVTALTLLDRHRNWLDGLIQHALIAVGGPAPAAGDERDDWAREDVACALRLSTAAAGARLQVARELHGRLARTGRAVDTGAITLLHARAIVDAVSVFDGDDGAGGGAEVARLVERAALDDGPPFETLTGFRRRLTRLVIAADPRTADEQHIDAVGTRRVLMYPEAFGMATLAATLTADEAATAMLALTGLARRAKDDGDQRPVDVRRADALAGLLAAALTDPGIPRGHGARPTIGVTIDLPTLLGLAEHPAHLDGYGPIPPVMARRIAAGGDWHRMVTDPANGALIDYGRSTYRPPADLAEFITARDRTCRFPTCNRQARLCDIDHAQPYDLANRGEGGSTSARNCGALCRRNHRQKTQRNTHLVSHPDGSTTWTTSTGHTIHLRCVPPTG